MPYEHRATNNAPCELANAARFTSNGSAEQRGFGTLLTALVVSVLGTVLLVPLILVGIGAEESGAVRTRGVQATQLANACAERALEEIRQQTSFSGGDTITAYATGECDYTVTDEGGQSRRVEATGRANDHTARVLVEIDNINPDINVTEWEEVTAF